MVIRQGSDFTFGVSDETFPKGFGEKAVSPINVSNEFFPYSSPPKKTPKDANISNLWIPPIGTAQCAVFWTLPHLYPIPLKTESRYLL